MNPKEENPNDFMHLMKDWYAESGKIVQYMLNSFSKPYVKDQSNSKGSSAEGRDDTGENLWSMYMENMDNVLKELGATFGPNNDLMEGVNHSWKEFSDLMSGYFTAIDTPQNPGTVVQPEIWTKWFEYSNKMNHQIFEYYQSFMSGPTGQVDPGMDGVTSGKPIQAQVPYRNAGKIDEQSFNEVNEICSKYFTDVTKEMMVANEAVLFRNANSVEQSQEFINKWSGIYNKFMLELIQTPAYNAILNDNLKQSFNAKKKLDESLEDHWRLLGLPTRTDVMELHRELHDLQLKLNRISKNLDKVERKKSRGKTR